MGEGWRGKELLSRSPFPLQDLSIPSIPPTVTAEMPKELADELGRKDGKGERHGSEELAGGQRSGAQDGAAEVDKGDLNDQDGEHDEQKNGIFGKSCKKVETVGTRVEAVEDRGKDEERKEGGQEVDTVGRVAVECGKKGTIEEHQTKRRGKSAADGDLVDTMTC